MEALKIKNYLVIAFIILTLTSCIKGEDKMEIIAYGTSEFDEFVKNAPISLDEAYELSNVFYKKNEGEEKKHTFSLYFIINSYYVFSPYVNLKIPNTNITGIWVNSKTGETKYVESKTEFRRQSMNGWIKK